MKRKSKAPKAANKAKTAEKPPEPTLAQQVLYWSGGEGEEGALNDAITAWSAAQEAEQAAGEHCDFVSRKREKVLAARTPVELLDALAMEAWDEHVRSILTPIAPAGKDFIDKALRCGATDQDIADAAKRASGATIYAKTNHSYFLCCSRWQFRRIGQDAPILDGLPVIVKHIRRLLAIPYPKDPPQPPKGEEKAKATRKRKANPEKPAAPAASKPDTAVEGLKDTHEPAGPGSVHSVPDSALPDTGEALQLDEEAAGPARQPHTFRKWFARVQKIEPGAKDCPNWHLLYEEGLTPAKAVKSPIWSEPAEAEQEKEKPFNPIMTAESATIPCDNPGVRVQIHTRREAGGGFTGGHDVHARGAPYYLERPHGFEERVRFPLRAEAMLSECDLIITGGGFGSPGDLEGVAAAEDCLAAVKAFGRKIAAPLFSANQGHALDKAYPWLAEEQPAEPAPTPPTPPGNTDPLAMGSPDRSISLDALQLSRDQLMATDCTGHLRGTRHTQGYVNKPIEYQGRLYAFVAWTSESGVLLPLLHPQEWKGKPRAHDDVRDKGDGSYCGCMVDVSGDHGPVKRIVGPLSKGLRVNLSQQQTAAA